MYGRMAMLVVAQSSPGPSVLQQDGANIGVTVYAPATGQRRSVTAQIDSGSTISGVDQGVLQAIGAPAIGSLPVGTPGGDVTDQLYDAQLLYGGVDLTQGLPGGVLGEYLPPPIQALIGRDVLEHYNFAYDGQQGSWTLSAKALAPVPPLATQVWGAVGLIALGAAITLAAEGIERHETRVHEGRQAA